MPRKGAPKGNTYGAGPHNISPKGRAALRHSNRKKMREQKGIFAPDFYDRPEIKKAHHENGIVQGKAAVERGDGIHAPGVAAFGGRRAYELGHGPFTNDNPKFEKYWSYGHHRRWHELSIRKADSKFCRFCDTEEGRKEATERAK
jgi:hypothetical protein